MFRREHPLRPRPVYSAVTRLEVKEKYHEQERNCTNPVGFHPEG
jgi:hypothetical protein